MGSKSSPPSPPDYTPIAEAQKATAEAQLALSREQFAWAKEQYAQDKQVTDKVVQRLLEAQDQQDQWARADRERYETQFQPLEDELIADAKSYASPERRELEMGRAQATVGQQFDAARDAATRQLESYGINPASTRFAALDLGLRAQEAAAKAGAGNQASYMVDATGRALRDSAINIGRGYPAQVVSQAGLANQSGTSGVNSNLATTASGATTAGTGTQWGALGTQNLAGWGNTLNMGYKNRLDAYEAEQKNSTGIGSILGLGASMLLGPTKPWIFAKEGGAIEDPAIAAPRTPGGAVPIGASPSAGAITDDVSARLTPGEFVLPVDVTNWYGERHLQQMIEKARKEKQGATAKPEVRQAILAPATFQSRPGGGGRGALPLR